MKDTYPVYDSVPPGNLVPPELQPEYTGTDPEAERSVADAILLGRAGDPARAALTAIVHHESASSLTFGELDARSRRMAAGLLARGLRQGDRVAVRSANRPEGIVSALAVWRSGGILVPIPMQARAEELNFFLVDTGARFLVSQLGEDRVDTVEMGVADSSVKQVLWFGDGPEGSESWAALTTGSGLIAELPAVDPDALAIIWHTGGTTGKPKACYHTHRRFLLAGYSIGEANQSGPGQRWAAAAPIGHALGFIYHTLYSLLHGATIVLIESFTRPDSVLHAIDDHGVDTFAAITATWALLMTALTADPALPVPPSALRGFAMWQSASASEVYDYWFDRGIVLRNNFGSTSFATWVLVPPAGVEVPRASLGRPAPGYEVIAIEPDCPDIIPVAAGTPGRMAVRGPSGLTYWNHADLQERDVRGGWTLVDDMIEIDADGNVAYLGRTDFLISTAGYKVAPVEVETVLAAHPAVREVAVLGLPDPIRQEVVCAYVALREGVVGDDELKRELQNAVKAELAPYKYPRVIEFIDALPRDSVGKVMHRRLGAPEASKRSSGRGVDVRTIESDERSVPCTN